ncbi:CHAT domain-containing protein, partial [Actinocorallia longicatena]|uniref:CHAT domain-containing protein n=1 Tax=Actinocorallia longicatena TaxID=111803 RepID=UPI0031D94CD7
AREDRRGTLAAVRAALRTAGDLAATAASLELRASIAARCADPLLRFAPLGLTARALLEVEELYRRILWAPREAGPGAAVEGTGPGHERRLREEARRVGARRREPAFGTADLPAVLGRTVLVEFVRAGDALTAVTVRDGRCRRFELAPYPELARELRFARLAATRALMDGGPEREAFAPLRGWFAEVLAEVAGRDVVIAPAGELHGMPWAALVEEPFSVVPSAAAWVSAVTAPPREGPVVPIAGAGAPHAAAEIRAVREIYGPSAAGPGALQRARVVHFAGHGTYRADDPLLSGLVTERGTVTGYELAGIGGAPELVVLSACDAGRGRDAVGIPGQLLALGVRTVIASVLPVDDARAVEFMAAVHRDLAAGSRPAEALAGAGREPGTLGFQCFGAG